MGVLSALMLGDRSGLQVVWGKRTSLLTLSLYRSKPARLLTERRMSDNTAGPVCAAGRGQQRSDGQNGADES